MFLEASSITKDTLVYNGIAQVYVSAIQNARIQHHHRNIMLFFIGKANDALSAYQQAIQLNYNHSVAYVNMGRLLRGAGQVHQAEKAFKK